MKALKDAEETSNDSDAVILKHRVQNKGDQLPEDDLSGTIDRMRRHARDAEANGKEDLKAPENLVDDNGDMFQIQIKKDMQADVPPLKIEIRKDAEAGILEESTTDEVLSDKGSVFKNRLTTFLLQKLGFDHHISTPSACRSGIVGTASVERLNRSIVRMLRAMISAKQLDMRSWPQLVPSIQMYLNCCAKKDLGGSSSVQVHTGLTPRPMTELAFFSQEDDIKAVRCYSITIKTVASYLRGLVKAM